MRAQSDPWFSNYLLRIGNGIKDTFAGDYVRLLKDIVIEYKDKHSIDNLIDCVCSLILAKMLVAPTTDVSVEFFA
jgi:hypothetical protein